MVVGITLAGLSLRAGLALRRARLGRRPRSPSLRCAHLRLAKPAIIWVMVGFAAGPPSAAVLRGWEPFGTLHAYLGALAAGLFAVAAVLGRRLERGDRRRVDAHALAGGLAVLAAALAAIAGFVLLP